MTTSLKQKKQSLCFLLVAETIKLRISFYRSLLLLQSQQKEVRKNKGNRKRQSRKKKKQKDQKPYFFCEPCISWKVLKELLKDDASNPNTAFFIVDLVEK